MSTPNRDNIQKWVDALRSGDYKQGNGCLRDHNDNYCCLGVACEVLGLEAVISKHIPDHDRYQYDNEIYFLPAAARDLLGLASDDSIIGYDPVQSEPICASGANDQLHLDFNEIADMLEKEYLS